MKPGTTTTTATATAIALVLAACGGKHEVPAGSILMGEDEVSLKTSIGELAGKLHHLCWELVVRDAARELVSAPCSSPVPPDAREIAVWVGRDKTRVGLTIAGEINEVGERRMLGDVLRNQKRAAAFKNRRDLAVALAPDLTLGDAVDVMMIARAEGFTSPRLVEPLSLPMPTLAE